MLLILAQQKMIEKLIVKLSDIKNDKRWIEQYG